MISCHIRKYEYVKICCCCICDTYANLLKGVIFLVLEVAIVSPLVTLADKTIPCYIFFSVVNGSCQAVQYCILSTQFFFLFSQSMHETCQTICLEFLFRAEMIKVLFFQ